MERTKLKIAIQKSGRLHEDSVRLLKDCGIEIKNGGNKLNLLLHTFRQVFYFFIINIPMNSLIPNV